MSSLPNLLRTIHPGYVPFIDGARTNRELLDFANKMLRPPGNDAVEIYMLLDVAQCLITFSACAYTLSKKGRMRKIAIVSLRKTPDGTFIVPNAVLAFLVGVCIFLLDWAGFAIYIVWVQKTNHLTSDWL